MIECSPGLQDCPDDQKCTPWKCGDGCCTNSTRCLPITGKAQAGEECTRDGPGQFDDCDAGLFCSPKGGTGGSGPGTCSVLCITPAEGEADHCSELGFPDLSCITFNGGSYPACKESCDPRLQDCSEEEKACYLAIDNFFCARPSAPAGGKGDPGDVGDECKTEQGCTPGLLCTPPELATDCNNNDCGSVDTCGCCSKVCDLDADDPDKDCAEGEACTRVLDNGTPASEGVGVCVVPNRSAEPEG